MKGGFKLILFLKNFNSCNGNNKQLIVKKTNSPGCKIRRYLNKKTDCISQYPLYFGVFSSETDNV